MTIKTANVLDVGASTFASGLLPELLGALRRCRPGDLLTIVSSVPALAGDMEAWCRFTRNTLVDTTIEDGRIRWIVRHGEVPPDGEMERPIGSRLWLYTNFDCNLQCDYCCVRSSPKT